MPEVKYTQYFNPRRIAALAISAASLLCYHHSALADTRFSSFNNNFSNDIPVDFSLSFSRKDLDLKSSSTTYSVRLRRINAKLSNEISQNINIGLILGSNFISQENDVATAGLSLNGNHIGFALNGIFGNDLRLGINASDIYQEANGGNTLRTASIAWHEWMTEATLRFKLGTHWAILAGAGIMGLDADRRVSGDINETIRMELTDNFQGKLAIEIFTAPADRIRLTLNQGAFNGPQLTFAHAF